MKSISEQIVTLVTGKQSFNDTSTSITVFKKTPGKKDMVFAGKALRAANKPTYTNAAKDGGTNNGKWITASFEVEDGDILCIHINSTYKGIVAKQAQILFRCSPIGHVYAIEARPVSDSRAAFREITVLQGKGHLLDLKMAKELKLVGLNSSMYEEDAVDDAFTITRVKEGTGLTVEKIPVGKGVATQAVLVPEGRKRRVRLS